MTPPAALTPYARHPHRLVGERQQSRPGAQHPPPGHPLGDPRGHAVPGGRCAGHHGAPPPDERHIRAQRRVRAGRTDASLARAEFNIEGNPTQNLMDFIRQCARTRPPLCPTAKTSSPATTAGAFRRMPQRLRPADCRMPQPGRARQPVHGPRARADGRRQGRRRRPRRAVHRALRRRLGHPPSRPQQLQRYADAAQAALAAGLGVNAGHDLNRDNLAAFVARRARRCRKCPSATR